MVERTFNRREALAGAATVGLGALLAACGAEEATRGASVEVPTEGGGAATVQPRGGGGRDTLFGTESNCSLTPEMTAGPYYFDVDKVRSDLREDREGVPLQLAIRVRDAACQPLPNAVVEIWHCDAQGLYSGFERASEGGPGGGRTDPKTYLRGAQVTDSNGIVEFTTIYPGRYPGRTTHIHAIVHLDRESALTTQLYFDDEVSAAVHADPRYQPGPEPQVGNAEDGIFDPATLLDLSAADDGYLGTISIDLRT